MKPKIGLGMTKAEIQRVLIFFFVERYALGILGFSSPVVSTTSIDDDDDDATTSPTMMNDDGAVMMSNTFNDATTSPTIMNDDAEILSMNNISSSTSNSTITTQWLSSDRQCTWHKLYVKKDWLYLFL